MPANESPKAASSSATVASGRSGQWRPSRRQERVATSKKVGAVADWRSWKLIVRDLAVERGDRRVLDHVTFTVGCAEAVVLRGPNGTGKTTLSRKLARILADDRRVQLRVPARGYAVYAPKLSQGASSGITAGRLRCMPPSDAVRLVKAALDHSLKSAGIETIDR